MIEFNPRLTSLETQVLQLVAEGLSNPVIAQRLHFSVGNVASVVATLYKKFGLTDDRHISPRVFVARWWLLKS